MTFPPTAVPALDVRLVLNLLLLRAGYAPALILREWRMGYLSALGRADQGQFGPLLNIIGRAVKRGFEPYLEACAATPEDARQPLPRSLPQPS